MLAFRSAGSVEHAIIEYNGTQINAVIDQDGTKWVAMRPIVAGIGMNLEGQRQKLQNDPKFSCLDIRATGSDGKKYKMLCLPFDELAAWLAGINVNKVHKPDVKAKVLLYQRECVEVLNNYWTKGAAINPRVSQETTPATVEQANDLAAAVMIRAMKTLLAEILPEGKGIVRVLVPNLEISRHALSRGRYLSFSRLQVLGSIIGTTIRAHIDFCRCPRWSKSTWLKTIL